MDSAAALGVAVSPPAATPAGGGVAAIVAALFLATGTSAFAGDHYALIVTLLSAEWILRRRWGLR